jgi:hypothetical protein
VASARPVGVAVANDDSAEPDRRRWVIALRLRGNVAGGAREQFDDRLECGHGLGLRLAGFRALRRGRRDTQAGQPFLVDADALGLSAGSEHSSTATRRPRAEQTD